MLVLDTMLVATIKRKCITNNDQIMIAHICAHICKAVLLGQW